MGSTQFGDFYYFCQAATLPVCNIFNEARDGSGYGGCPRTGIPLSGNRNLKNLGSIILCGFAVLTSLFLIFKSDRKKAAVGRREMQLFLLGYIIISICEIFTVGGFSLDSNVRIAFTAIHIGAITATTWVLLLNGVVGFQWLDDGTLFSIGLILASAIVMFIGSGYLVLDTAHSWTHHFDDSLVFPNRNIGIYVLYQLVPLIFLVFYFLLETYLVVKVLGELRPMIYLIGAALLFAVGQIFQYVVSSHICDGTSGKIDGALFETLFTLLSVVMVWVFWSSITEDDWPMPVTNTYGEGVYT